MWEKVKKFMDERQLTMYALSKKAGISQSILINLKAKRTTTFSFETACKIADALGISLDEFR